MKIVLKADEMKKCDFNTINHFGIKSNVLMERASLSVFSMLCEHMDKYSKILVFVGIGNNGGDGVCLARLLYNFGFNVAILLTGDESKFSEGLIEQLTISRKYNIREVDKDSICEYDVLVDAMFGIGLSRDITGDFAKYVSLFNKADAYKMAIDIPSGINTDTGQIMGVACKVNSTVTFNYRKPGNLIYPGRENCGTTYICDIGINDNSFLNDIKPSIYSIDEKDIMCLDNRKADSNKGDFGKVLIIAGSNGMSGAAYFSAKAALKMGAGLVKIYTTSDNREIIQTLLPEAVISCYDEYDENTLGEMLEWSSVCAIGPGLGKSDISRRIVEYVIKKYDKELVVDADAINIISDNTAILNNNTCPIIITPHLGEMRRLTGDEIEDIKKDMIGKALACTDRFNVITVLKAASSVISLPDGNVFINTTGNNGMSTAGSGDVLTGIIAGVIAGGIDSSIAAPLSVYIHGLCADKAVEKLGAHSLCASDIIDMLSVVLKEGLKIE